MGKLGGGAAEYEAVAGGARHDLRVPARANGCNNREWRRKDVWYVCSIVSPLRVFIRRCFLPFNTYSSALIVTLHIRLVRCLRLAHRCGRKRRSQGASHVCQKGGENRSAIEGGGGNRSISSGIGRLFARRRRGNNGVLQSTKTKRGAFCGVHTCRDGSL